MIFRIAVLLCALNVATSFTVPHVKQGVRSFGLRPSTLVFSQEEGSQEEASEAADAVSAAEVEKEEVVTVESSEPEASTDGEVADDTDVGADAETEVKPKRKLERKRYTIFVGNLPFTTNDTEIRELFSAQGTVELVSVPRNPNTGQAKGFAFVDMSSAEEVEKAVAAITGTDLGGRTLRVMESLPKEKVKKQGKKFDEGVKKIYVGNLPFDVASEDLTEYFGQFGDVYDLYIPADPNTGRSRGFAFLSLKEEELEKTIEATNGADFMGRRLSVSVPLPPGEKAKVKKIVNRTKLYVGNLSFYTLEETLRELFEEFGPVRDCYLPADPQTGGSRGFGFVTMDNEAAMIAIEETDGCELDGRIIRVNEAQPKKVEDEEEEDSVDEDEDF